MAFLGNIGYSEMAHNFRPTGCRMVFGKTTTTAVPGQILHAQNHDVDQFQILAELHAVSLAMVCRNLAKMISYHRAKLAECLKADVLRQPQNRGLRNLAIARNRSGTFESNHFRPFHNLPRDLFETVGKDDLSLGDLVLQFLQCRGRTMVSIL